MQAVTDINVYRAKGWWATIGSLLALGLIPGNPKSGEAAALRLISELAITIAGFVAINSFGGTPWTVGAVVIYVLAYGMK